MIKTLRVNLTIGVKNLLGVSSAFERRAKILANLSGVPFAECLRRIQVENRTPENIEWEKKILLNGYSRVFTNEKT